MVAFIFSAVEADKAHRLPNFYLLLGFALIVILWVFSCCGHFTLQPNEARVLTLFGTTAAPNGKADSTGPIH